MNINDKPHNFLGTMAGQETYLQGNQGKPTYARKYQPFGGSTDLRKKISKMGFDHAKGYKEMGEAYSYTPFYATTRPFGSKPGSMPGGGFFITLKEFSSEDQEQFLNCFAYALTSFGEKIERVAGKSIKELQESVGSSIDNEVNKNFINVEKPRDGDLVIYSANKVESFINDLDSRMTILTTHAGIYRDSLPNWSSPYDGTVESKWGGFNNPYVFQHDLFFTPDFYGDTVRFYRLKDQ